MAFPGGQINFAKRRNFKFTRHVMSGGFHVSGISGGLEKSTRQIAKKAVEEQNQKRKAQAAAQAKKEATRASQVAAELETVQRRAKAEALRKASREEARLRFAAASVIVKAWRARGHRRAVAAGLVQRRWRAAISRMRHAASLLRVAVRLRYFLVTWTTRYRHEKARKTKEAEARLRCMLALRSVVSGAQTLAQEGMDAAMTGMSKAAKRGAEEKIRALAEHLTRSTLSLQRHFRRRRWLRSAERQQILEERVKQAKTRCVVSSSSIFGKRLVDAIAFDEGAASGTMHLPSAPSTTGSCGDTSNGNGAYSVRRIDGIASRLRDSFQVMPPAPKIFSSEESRGSKVKDVAAIHAAREESFKQERHRRLANISMLKRAREEVLAAAVVEAEAEEARRAAEKQRLDEMEQKRLVRARELGRARAAAQKAESLEAARRQKERASREEAAKEARRLASEAAELEAKRERLVRRDRRLAGEAQRRLKRWAGLLRARICREQASALGRVKAIVRVRRLRRAERRRALEEREAAAAASAKCAALPQGFNGSVGETVGGCETGGIKRKGSGHRPVSSNAAAIRPTTSGQDFAVAEGEERRPATTAVDIQSAPRRKTGKRRRKKSKETAYHQDGGQEKVPGEYQAVIDSVDATRPKSSLATTKKKSDSSDKKKKQILRPAKQERDPARGHSKHQRSQQQTKVKESKQPRPNDLPKALDSRGESENFRFLAAPSQSCASDESLGAFSKKAQAAVAAALEAMRDIWDGSDADFARAEDTSPQQKQLMMQKRENRRIEAADSLHVDESQNDVEGSATQKTRDGTFDHHIDNKHSLGNTGKKKNVRGNITRGNASIVIASPKFGGMSTHELKFLSPKSIPKMHQSTANKKNAAHTLPHSPCPEVDDDNVDVLAQFPDDFEQESRDVPGIFIVR